MSSLSAVLLITGFIGLHGSSDEKPKKLPKGMRDSDSRLTGPRDMNYDHMIVTGDRIGPVRMGAPVSAALRYLGNPDIVVHTTILGPHNGYAVWYFYKEECISFLWQDFGIEPTIIREHGRDTSPRSATNGAPQAGCM